MAVKAIALDDDNVQHLIIGLNRENIESLLRGDVFTKDVIDTWISYKMKNEVDAMALRPHPYEFCLYYDM